MSAMLGSSRRDARTPIRVDGDEISLLGRPAGSLMALLGRLLARLGAFFSPPESRS
jgi:hypothetical protein